MVDRFANGDPTNDADADPSDPQAFHGGDLQGVIDHLDELQALGIKTLWLSPVFAMRDEPFHGHGAFHGYWIDDFGRVEPRFGDEATLRRLRDELAKREMRLLLDVVLNHVAMDHPLTRQKPDWFHGKGGITDWSDPQQITDHDVHGLPDLDQENPEVYDHLLGHSLGWIARLQPAGFRLDAVKHVPADFWQRYNAEIYERAGQGFVILGEQLDGDPQTVARTVEEGRFNAIFDFPLHFAMVDVFCRDAHPGRLASVLWDDRLYPEVIHAADRSGLVTLLDNHDLPRILSACADDPERVIDALTFMLSARGTPSFTWGTEAGLAGKGEPENRADMRFGVAYPVGEAMRELLEQRREHAVLRDGRDLPLVVDDELFAYLRVGEEETALVAVNRGGEARDVALPAGLGTESAPVPAGEVLVRFFTGTPDDARPATREVLLELPPTARLVGSGPELGSWDPARGLRDGARLDLPVGATHAFKLVFDGAGDEVRWEEGDNRYLFVAPASTPLRVEVEAR